MPTGAKFIGALFFAALGFYVAGLVIPLLPEGTRTGWLHEVGAALGLLFGWTMAGKNAGSGYRASAGYGLTAAALMIFWGVVIFAGVEMLELSMDRRYKGPMQAIKSMISIAIENFRTVGTFEVATVLAVGGIVGGWFAEWTSKRWA